MKTWDFSFWLQDIIVRKLEYSVGFMVELLVELKLEYSVELKLDFSVELID